MKSGFGFLISSVVFILTTYIRFRWGWNVDFYITSLVYFILTIVTINVFKINNVKQYCYFQIAAIFFLIILGLIIDFIENGNIAWAPAYYPNPIHYCLAIILAYHFNNKRKSIAAFCIFMSLMLIHKIYYPSLERYTNYETFNSAVSEKFMNNVNVYDENGKVYKIKSENGKYLILDFWFKGCGPCYRSFPILEEIFRKNKDNLDIMCINYPIDDVKSNEFNPFENLRSKGYTFPIFQGDTSLASKFKIITFPTVILIKDNEILFRGSLEELKKVYKL